MVLRADRPDYRTDRRGTQPRFAIGRGVVVQVSAVLVSIGDGKYTGAGLVTALADSLRESVLAVRGSTVELMTKRVP